MINLEGFIGNDTGNKNSILKGFSNAKDVLEKGTYKHNAANDAKGISGTEWHRKSTKDLIDTHNSNAKISYATYKQEGKHTKNTKNLNKINSEIIQHLNERHNKAEENKNDYESIKNFPKRQKEHIAKYKSGNNPSKEEIKEYNTHASHYNEAHKRLLSSKDEE